ncbi:hypothetical protein ZOSMA_28G00030 [Zostera marina]|uniref:SRR1-like domain-containing protein n=1 Tax=Zostera marina TaxID=29655 RepID=A0A0K9PEL6_ZOSMR|nr:hypothetical protein ZOSMA_28G00030 [Zostera marina]
MVVYGIGSIESYEPPRLQLSLALLLHRHLSLPDPIEIFDPILTSLECAAIAMLGFNVLEVDEMGRREVRSPTLFYMPHCEAKMYDNLLAENWKEKEGGGLDRIVVLGNSFKEYETYVYGMGKASRIVEEARFVVKASSITTEVGIVNGGGVKEEDEVEDGFFKAFNNTNWHCFGSHK